MIGLTIDPGISTGICAFEWDDETPFHGLKLWQFRGGAEALHRWLGLHIITSLDRAYLDGEPLDALIVEKFTPRQNEGFNLTRDSAEPLRGEGVLIGHGLGPFVTSWAEPVAQYFMGGEVLKDRKKRSREFLKANEMHLTGKTVGQPDADDAISATLHSIAWLRRQRHMPTLRALFPETRTEKGTSR